MYKLLVVTAATLTYARVLSMNLIGEPSSPQLEYSDEQLVLFQEQMHEWTQYFDELDKNGGVNLNEFGDWHQKSVKKSENGATMGISILVNEIVYFYLEENTHTEFQWQISIAPKVNHTKSGTMYYTNHINPLGKDFPSHVFEIVSNEYRPKPALPGVSSTGGMRIIGVRGREFGEVEMADSL
jgi:hypothetical protein